MYSSVGPPGRHFRATGHTCVNNSTLRKLSRNNQHSTLAKHRSNKVTRKHTASRMHVLHICVTTTSSHFIATGYRSVNKLPKLVTSVTLNLSISHCRMRKRQSTAQRIASRMYILHKLVRRHRRQFKCDGVNNLPKVVTYYCHNRQSHLSL